MEKPEFNPLDEALFDSRIVLIDGPVGFELAHKINKMLLALEKRDAHKPIYMHINSPGGEVTSGFSIFDTARFIKPEIITIVTGLAASMGSIIALAADKKNRFAMPNSKFLIHQPLISGVITGPASDLEIHARDILRTKEKINLLYAKETGKPLAEVAKLTERDTWMTSEEALDFGLVCKIITSREDISSKH